MRVPSRSYYYVPKKKKGPGLKGWLVAGGVLVGMTGFGIAVLGEENLQFVCKLKRMEDGN